MPGTLHSIAVYVLCAVAAWFAYERLRDLFIVWYSGCEELALTTKLWIWCQILVAVAAATLAIATL